MLSNLKEDLNTKCDLYWPKDLASPILFENLKIILESEFFILDKGVMLRNIRIEYFEERFSVIQLHVVCWPDHSTPEEDIGFKMIEIVLSYVEETRKIEKSPIVIHCRYIT